MPVLLLLSLSIALSIGLGFAMVLVRQARREKLAPKRDIAPASHGSNEPPSAVRRPACWLAVKTRSIAAVQSALGLHNPKPCSWIEGLAGDEKLFVAPPVKGWVLVMGSGVPDPSEDVDACFRFVMRLSRKLGQVQLFCANRLLHHHAWVRADGGKVVRAYAWAGKTLWQQGARTSAEKELDLKCFDYTEPVERVSFGQPDAISLNVDKVPLLAARWSLDPARIDQRFLERERGVAGEPSLRF
jgi:hypothetical protein